MNDAQKQQVEEDIEHCKKIVCNLLDKYKSHLLEGKQSLTGHSDVQVNDGTLVEEANEPSVDLEFASESIEGQLKLTAEEYGKIQLFLQLQSSVAAQSTLPSGQLGMFSLSLLSQLPPCLTMAPFGLQSQKCRLLVMIMLPLMVILGSFRKNPPKRAPSRFCLMCQC